MALGPTREALRDATGAAHERLHEVPAFHRLGAGVLTRAEYVALLRRLLGFHAALEDHLPAACHGLDLAARRRAGLLRADLAFLGADDRAARAPLRPPPDAAWAMGALYVSEGSTLGGQHLARGLDHLLPEGGGGRAFLLGHGARHGAMWREFCGALEQAGEDPRDRAAIIAGAVATFAAFEAWFAE